MTSLDLTDDQNLGSDQRPGTDQKPGTDHEYVVVARTAVDRPGTLVTGSGEIPIDARWGGGQAVAGELPGPGPAELLAGAFAACLLKNLARARSLLDFEYTGATVEVTLTRQDSPPRFQAVRYRMVIDTVEPQRRVELVHRNLRKYGTVYNTLAAVCDVEGTVAAEVGEHSTFRSR